MERRRPIWPILLLVAVVAFLFGSGILYFSSREDSYSLEVDKSKVQEGTRDALETGKELGEKAADKTKEAVDKVRVEVED